METKKSQFNDRQILIIVLMTFNRTTVLGGNCHMPSTRKYRPVNLDVLPSSVLYADNTVCNTDMILRRPSIIIIFMRVLIASAPD